VAVPLPTLLPPPSSDQLPWPWNGPRQTGVGDLSMIQRRPLISIVTPSLNQGSYLEQAIRSVLLQGYPNLELIVVDGGSTDRTLATLKKYDPWLTHWVSEPDSGPTHALNRGFESASGEILAFLNADDFYLAGCLERIAREFIENPDVDVVSGHGYLTDRSGRLGVPIFSDPWDYQRFRYGACVLVQPATFFRRTVFEKVGGFRHETTSCWDAELWADMAERGATFQLIEEYLATFRLHPDSISGSVQLTERRREDFRLVMTRMIGREESISDRCVRAYYRALKFAGHPLRTLRQRAFIRNALRPDGSEPAYP
jgi:glycosyltransferase involved in cell wall biosynthesis